MRNLVLIIFAFFAISISGVFAQVVKLEHGLAFSWMKGDNLENKLLTYSVIFGCDYLEHDWFYLSSEIGYIRKGGKDKIYDIFVINEHQTRIGYEDISSSADYLHVNTSFRVKHTFNNVTFYTGFAPTLDFLIKEKSYTQFDDRKLRNDYNANKIVFGIKPEIGAYYDVAKLRFSFDVSYLRNITHLAKIEKIGYLNNNTILMSIGIGCKL